MGVIERVRGCKLFLSGDKFSAQQMAAYLEISREAVNGALGVMLERQEIAVVSFSRASMMYRRYQPNMLLRKPWTRQALEGVSL